MENFRDKVQKAVSQIPAGKVASYGQIAALCGSPRAARQVGQVLKSLDPGTNIPWWRVVNNQGYLSIRGNWGADKQLQKQMLEREQVAVSQALYVDMGIYRYTFGR